MCMYLLKMKCLEDLSASGIFVLSECFHIIFSLCVIHNDTQDVAVVLGN